MNSSLDAREAGDYYIVPCVVLKPARMGWVETEWAAAPDLDRWTGQAVCGFLVEVEGS